MDLTRNYDKISQLAFQLSNDFFAHKNKRLVPWAAQGGLLIFV